MSSIEDDLTVPTADLDTVAGERAFRGEITVSSRIIDQLSSGLYDSPASCLKELINNSYDADASAVKMYIRPDADVIVIEDDGSGLSQTTFERHFRRIAQSHKRDDSDKTPSGRPKIGKIGIGFVAANEICDRMTVESSMEGSVELLQVTIDFAKMRDDPASRRREGEDLAKGDYVGQVTMTAPSPDHFTRIYLRDVRGEARDLLSGAEPGKGNKSLYGLSPGSVKRRLSEPTLATWGEFDSYSRALLEIGLNVPVAYHDGWIPSSEHQKVTPFEKRAKSLGFKVVVDGSELRKPVVLHEDPDGLLVRPFAIKGDYMSAEGYLYACSRAIKPRELNGLLLRIRNAGVSRFYDRSYLDFPGWQSALFQDWTSVEVYADDRLEDALNIDRRTLRVTHPAYVELRDQLHGELRTFFADVRRELYGRRSARRREERANTQAQKLNTISERLGATVGDAAADELLDVFRETKPGRSRRTTIKPTTIRSPASQEGPARGLDVAALTRTYTGAEVIDIVVQAAEQAGLSAEQTRRLVAEVVGRLRA